MSVWCRAGVCWCGVAVVSSICEWWLRVVDVVKAVVGWWFAGGGEGGGKLSRHLAVSYIGR